MQCPSVRALNDARASNDIIYIPNPAETKRVTERNEMEKVNEK